MYIEPIFSVKTRIRNLNYQRPHSVGQMARTKAAEPAEKADNKLAFIKMAKYTVFHTDAEIIASDPKLLRALMAFEKVSVERDEALLEGKEAGQRDGEGQ